MLGRLRAYVRRSPEPLAPLRSVPGWMHVGMLAAISLLTLYISLGMWGWTYDDAYIIYRYARNFAEGLGMVYNPGEPYLGTSSAGYTLILAALYRLMPGSDLLTLGSVVSAVGLWASGALVWIIGVQTRALLAGALAALFTVANPLMLQSWGGEMPLLVALVLGTIVAYSRGMGTLTGLLLGMAVLTRQDSLVLVALIGAHYIWTRRRLPLKGAVAFFGVLLPWVAYSWAFFGSPLPGTLEAKIAQGKAGWGYFFSGALAWLSQTLGPGLPRTLTLELARIGILVLVWDTARKRYMEPWALLFGWVALFTVGYTALRVAFYSWYAAPLSVGIGILVAWGLAGVVRAVGWAISRGWEKLRARARPGAGEGSFAESGRLRLVKWTLMAATLLTLLFPLVERLRLFDVNFLITHRESDMYAQVGQWLAAHGGGATSVAFLEIGEVGYYSQARVIDLVGLVTPGVSAHVPMFDYGWAVQRYQPEYYLRHSRFDGLLGNLSQEKWFTEAYTSVVTFADRPSRGETVGGVMEVYRRKPGASLPPPLRPLLVQQHSQQPAWFFPGATEQGWHGQTFTSPASNISAIALLVGIPKPVPTGTLVLHLRSSPASSQDLRRVEAPLSEIPNNAWLTFRFEPLPDSAGQSYFITMELTGHPSGPAPLALWHATDDLYPGGTRMEGTKPVEGDLCLRVSVPDSRP